MKFSTRSSYGLRAVIDLAKNYGQGALSLHEISKKEKISQSYLERLMASLKMAKIIKSTRGVKGGYELTRAPSKVSVAEVVTALEGSLAPFTCVDGDVKLICKDECCKVRKVWIELKRSMEKTLEGMMLSDLL
ncbi:Rrf2 family transcriptional regulator [Patescibacteria group bacterium]|nr:Rrf2 family transcriptional regulator [Patescibacteria group bacterium]MBU4512466.1 Rrf2 family transcriptional regulator [Patescibacteria group bacterium]MCG2692594.1 Rrf2 family transcriptional regulator [Candidatus Parcubacteria bacterium]